MNPPSSQTSSLEPALPLDGLVVVAVEQAVAAPLATRQLADLGARVIKLERPGEGDFARHYDHDVAGVSAYFAWLNRGKESVVVDLKSEPGMQTVENLLARADVFVQNLAPGAAARLGLDAKSLVSRFPRLIAGDLSGYGEGGPYGARKAYDLLIQAEAGLISITGTDSTPAKAGISIADVAAGMYLFSSVLAGLYERERTGTGTTVEVSLLEALAEWMGQPVYQARHSGAAPPRNAARHASIAPYGPFATSDGTLVVGLQNEREWQLFCHQVLEMPGLGSDPRFGSNAKRVAAGDELTQLIASVFGGLSTEAAETRLSAAGIAFGRERSPAELRDHPQLVGRDRWRTVGAPEGEIDALLPPFSIGGREPRMGAVPALGEHTAAVLQWIQEPAVEREYGDQQ